MRYPAALCPLAIAAVVASSQADAKRAGAIVNDAAHFYHQGLFDSALVRLEALQSQGPFKRRDSLSLYQYLGMASARLGQDSQAVAYFTRLLRLDSLFQFPKNEDAQVLQAFDRAHEAKNAAGIPEASAIPGAGNPSAPPPAPSESAPATFAGLSLRSAPPAPAGSTETLSLRASGGLTEKTGPGNAHVGLALGAVPLGAGWLVRNRVKHGVALGILQAGGIAISIYASEMQSREENDAFRVKNENERGNLQSWQWVQRVSLSTALGAYLFSLIASAGD